VQAVRGSIALTVAAGVVLLALGGSAWGRPDALPTLRVTVKGKGTVVGAPGAVKCPGKCLARVRAGTSVTLTAHPAAGWKLYG
jgi:hypothetical protein